MAYETEDDILYNYIEDGETEAVLPDGITEIYDYAFAGCRLERVVIPQGVKRIGQRAFMQCVGLREICLPDSLEEIGSAAFIDCISLGSLKLPDGLRRIGDSAFRCCEGLREAVIPDSVEHIGDSAFSGCICLDKAKLPAGLTILRKRVFSDCMSLTAISLPGSMRTIDDYAFGGCAELCSVHLNDGLEYIGRHTFDGCGSLGRIDIPLSVRDIGCSAFYRTPVIAAEGSSFTVLGDGILIHYSGGEQADIPDGVKKIGERAFSFSEKLIRVSLPDSVAEICDYAFESCRSLSEIRLPDSLRRIGAHAFEECASLSELTLPCSVESIGERLLYGTPIAASYEGMLILGGRYLLTADDVEEIIVPEGVTVIADDAFSGCRELRRISLPEGLVTVGANAFKWCGRLEDVRLPDSVTYIGDEAFGGIIHRRISLSSGNGLRLGENAFAEGSVLELRCGGRSFSIELIRDTPVCGGEMPAVFLFASQPNDESFGKIAEAEYAIPAAAEFHGELEACRRYLADNMTEAVCFALDRSGDALFGRLLGFGYLDARSADVCIERAITLGRIEEQMQLMRYKRERFGAGDALADADELLGL